MELAINPKRFAAWLILVVAFCNCVPAQEATPLGPLVPSDTSSPAATLGSLIDSCNQLHAYIQQGAFTEERSTETLPTIERILDCLDLSELPKDLRNTAGIESALFLKEVLDRIELPADAGIPTVTDLESSALGEPLKQWQIPGARIAIARNEQGSQPKAYLFSPDSVRRASQFYQMVKGLSYRSDGRQVSPGLYDGYVAATKRKPTLIANTSSPRGTLTVFLDTCNELYAEIHKNRYFDRSDPDFQGLAIRIIGCLDTSQLPEYSREYFDAEAAVCLKELLDRVPLPSAEEIPGIESVEAGSGAEALTRWQVPHTQITIVRMEEGPRRGEFLFSAATVLRAPELYRKALAQPYRKDGQAVSEGLYEWWLSRPGYPLVAAVVDGLPEWFQNRFLSMAVWQWIGLAVVVPISLALLIFAYRFARLRGDSMQDRTLLRYWLSLIFPFLGMLVPWGFKHVAWEYLTIRGSAMYVVGFCADVVFLLAGMVVTVRVSSRVAESFVALPGISPTGLDANLVRIICRLLGISVAVIILLEGGRYLGFPVTTLIASAGVGGLAIALSAQGLIKGLFGTVTILLDKPYRVGERIVALGQDGVVEEIGLRSTKIRALDNRLISIPNDVLAQAEIENIGSFNCVRQIADIHIPLDTPRHHIVQALDCIRKALDNHEGMIAELPPRVHFTQFNADSFNIRVTYWFTPPNIWKLQAFAEAINLQIMESFEKNGIQFSLPFRHSYWKQDAQQGPLEVLLKSELE